MSVRHSNQDMLLPKENWHSGDGIEYGHKGPCRVFTLSHHTWQSL